MPASPGLPGKLPPLASLQAPEARFVALRLLVEGLAFAALLRFGGGTGATLVDADDSGPMFSVGLVGTVDNARRPLPVSADAFAGIGGGGFAREPKKPLDGVPASFGLDGSAGRSLVSGDRSVTWDNGEG